MCDGARDETTWTVKYCANGELLASPAGFTYTFSDKTEAVEFLQSRRDAAALEVVAVPNPV